MAKKRRKRVRRPATSTAPAARTASAAPAAAPRQEEASPERQAARREQKEAARRAKEQALKRLRRREALRRVAVWGSAGVLIALGGFLLIRQNTKQNEVVAAAKTAATAAGCTQPTGQPPDPSYQPNLGLAGVHLTPGESPPTYASKPATSGKHDPSPLPPTPRVSREPLPEIRAVHNLEHAYVIVYYRADGDGALPDPVVTALASYVEGQDKVLMAPYPDLPAGEALALAAWTQLQTCPAAHDGTPITAEQAVTVAKGFVQRFRGSSDAPEPSAA